MTPAALHALFELAAYAVGFHCFRWLARRGGQPALADPVARWGVVAGAIVGAAIGAKLAWWAEDPRTAFANFPDLRALLAGKSVLGGLLGGVLGVEAAKRRLGITASTGDGFVAPIALGLAVGRLGCHATGLADHTVGVPSALPWAVDYGDGVPRHPTALYEIVAVLALAATVHALRDRLTRPGDRFRAFLIGYCLFRLAIETLKPHPYLWPGGISGLQLVSLAGLVYYHRDIVRAIRSLRWARS